MSSLTRSCILLSVSACCPIYSFQYRDGSSPVYTPVSRARERIVGPPLDPLPRPLSRRRERGDRQVGVRARFFAPQNDESHTPVSRARERIVGPPLLIRFVCIGCPLPQFGIANSRKSFPIASTFRK